MVVPLGPGKFYGSSLPRPRIYTDSKFNPERVDPPLPVLDPLLSWANEAHWSMGGLSFKRLRLQGRIEGNVKKLRTQREKILESCPEKDSTVKRRRAVSVSPPPARVAAKRRRYLALDDDENQGIEFSKVSRRGAVRKLGDDFERVAKESNMVKLAEDMNGGLKSEEKKGKKERKEKATSSRQPKGIRTSPRMSKRWST